MPIKEGKLRGMKMCMLFVIVLLSFLSKSVAQSRNLAALVGRWETIESKYDGGGFEVMDTTHIILFYGKERKPLLSFNADFTKSPAWFDFTVKDTTGTVKLQSLLQVINDDLIQWQLFDGTRSDYFTASNGEIMYLRRKQ